MIRLQSGVLLVAIGAPPDGARVERPCLMRIKKEQDDFNAAAGATSGESSTACTKPQLAWSIGRRGEGVGVGRVDRGKTIRNRGAEVDPPGLHPDM